MPTSLNTLSEVRYGSDGDSSHVRACTNCVRAKAKCSKAVEVKGKCPRYDIFKAASVVTFYLIILGRCLRMNKDCQPSPPMRKRRAISRPTVKKTSKLEEKIDGLM